MSYEFIKVTTTVFMKTFKKATTNIHQKVWRIFIWLIFIFFLVFGIPIMEKILHPNMTSKVEAMLNGSEFAECDVTVNRIDEVSILITVKPNDKSSIRTEFYDYFVKDLSKISEEPTLFNHTINQHPNGTFYLTRTQIWADAQLKKAKRIAVEYCDLLKDPDGRVAYDGHVPVYECAVPVVRATCFAEGEAENRSN